MINYLEDENENDEDNNAIKFESLESFSDDNENYNENNEEQEIFISQKAEQENVKSEGFTCDLCDYSSKNPKLLIAHVKNIHRHSIYIRTVSSWRLLPTLPN